MNKKENKSVKNTDKSKKLNLKITSLDIDKREYQEIVLSNSNRPDNGYFGQNRYD